MAEVQDVCERSFRFYRRVIFAIAWWRWLNMTTYSPGCLTIGFQGKEYLPATVLAIFF